MIRRYIVRRIDGREIRVEITGCFWCGDREHVCAACCAKANEVISDRSPEARTEEDLLVEPRGA